MTSSAISRAAATAQLSAPTRPYIEPATIEALRELAVRSVRTADPPSLLRVLADLLPADPSTGIVPESSTAVQADLTVVQVAHLFDRKPQTVRSWIKDGRLTAYKLHRREYRVTRAAIEEFQKQARQGAAQASGPSTSIDLSSWRKVRDSGGAFRS